MNGLSHTRPEPGMRERGTVIHDKRERQTLCLGLQIGFLRTRTRANKPRRNHARVSRRLRTRGHTRSHKDKQDAPLGQMDVHPRRTQDPHGIFLSHLSLSL